MMGSVVTLSRVASICSTGTVDVAVSASELATENSGADHTSVTLRGPMSSRFTRAESLFGLCDRRHHRRRRKQHKGDGEDPHHDHQGTVCVSCGAGVHVCPPGIETVPLVARHEQASGPRSRVLPECSPSHSGRRHRSLARGSTAHATRFQFPSAAKGPRPTTLRSSRCSAPLDGS